MRILRCTCTGCAVGEFKIIGRSGVRRSSALGPDRLGHARAFRLGTRTKLKPPVLWLTNLEGGQRPHNSIFGISATVLACSPAMWMRWRWLGGRRTSDERPPKPHI
eukprot:scaffold26215_cov107-Isochrysis_galbana.AAC.4